MRRRALLAVAALLGIGGIVVAVLRRPATDVPPPAEEAGGGKPLDARPPSSPHAAKAVPGNGTSELKFDEPLDPSAFQVEPDKIQVIDDPQLVEAIKDRFQRSPLRGTVSMPDGTPAAGATVSNQDRQWREPRDVTTDAQGSFSLHVVGDHEHRLRAVLSRGGEFSADAVVASDATETRVTLKPGVGEGWLLVRVVDGNGVPVPVADVTLAGGSWARFGSVEDGRGSLELSDERERASMDHLVVERARAADGSPLPWGSARADGVKAGGIYDVRLPPERAVAGVVVDADGRGVPGVRVRVERADLYDVHDLGGGPDERGALTDGTGAFRVGQLGAGEHVAFAEPPPEFLAASAVRVHEGASDARIELRPGTAPTIRVVDHDGKPVQGATVQVSERAAPSSLSGRRLTEVATGDDGSARIPHLDPRATCNLSVLPQSPWGSSPPSRPVRVHRRGEPTEHEPRELTFVPWIRKDWSPADTTVTVETGYEVAGTVRDRSGAAVSRAYVRIQSADGRVDFETAERDGWFSFAGIREGTAKLRASVRREDLIGVADERSSTNVQAGTRDVVLVIDAGAELSVRLVGAESGGDTRQAMLFPDGETTPRHSELRLEYVSVTGVLSFRGLRADVGYTLWMPPDAKGRSVYETGLRAGAAEAKATLVERKSIRGRIAAPAGAARVVVGVLGLGVQVDGTVDADGRYEVRGLPDGRWTVVAGAFLDDAPWIAKADADAGAAVDLTLAPAPPRTK